MHLYRYSCTRKYFSFTMNFHHGSSHFHLYCQLDPSSFGTGIFGFYVCALRFLCDLHYHPLKSLVSIAGPQMIQPIKEMIRDYCDNLWFNWARLSWLNPHRERGREKGKEEEEEMYFVREMVFVILPGFDNDASLAQLLKCRYCRVNNKIDVIFPLLGISVSFQVHVSYNEAKD